MLVLLLDTAVHGLGGSPVETIDYDVPSGDSLWSIADSVTEEGEDLRGVVATIRHLNDLSTVVIRPGDVLELPVDE
jgi:LysM repeat protein